MNKSDNKNIKKRIVTIVFNILITIAVLPFAISVLFQNPIVQTITAKLATKVLSNSIKQNISLSAIQLGFFTGIDITDLKIDDHHNNTMLAIHKLRAIPKLRSFSLDNINFSRVTLDSVIFNLGTYKGDTTVNLSMFINEAMPYKRNPKNIFRLFTESLVVTNSQFNLFDKNKTTDNKPNSMDYSDIEIENININASKFTLINDSINFKANNISAIEKSGITVKKMVSNIIISSTGIYTNNTSLHLNHSDINADLGLKYSSFAAFSHYIDSVNMIAIIRPTTINMADIGFFADVLFKMPNTIGITGKISGTVNNLKGTNLRIKYGNNTRFSGELQFMGLPNFYNTHMVGTKLNITSNASDISKFFLPTDDKNIDVSDYLPANKQVSILGNFDGYFKDFKSNINLSTSYGAITSNVVFKQTDDNSINFEITAKGDTVDIGDYLDKPNVLGKMTFDLKLTGSGNSENQISYSLGGKLFNVDLLGYNYSRISIIGDYGNNLATVNLRVGDKNLMMTADATAKLTSLPVFTVKSDIVSANLNKLNLWSSQKLNLSSQVNAKVVGYDINTLNASIVLKQNKLTFEKNKYVIDSIKLLKTTDSVGVTNISLKSDVAFANITGRYNIATFVTSVFKLANNYVNIMPAMDTTGIYANKYANIGLTILKPKIINNQFLDRISISENTKLQANLKFDNNSINLNSTAGKIQIADTKLDSCTFSINSNRDTLICKLNILNIVLKEPTESDTLEFGLDNFDLSANVHQDSIIYGIAWNNGDTQLKNSGSIEGYISHKKDSTNFSIGTTNVYVNDTLWTIDPGNLVQINNGRIFFHNIFINAGKSAFKLTGTLPKEDNDSLVAKFVNWNLSTFDILTTPMNIDLDGSINGELNYSRIKNNPTFVSNIRIKDLALNKQYLGDAHLLNTWDNINSSVFIKSQIIRQGNVGRGEIFMADGYFYPFKKDNNIDINVSFNHLRLKIFEPFVRNFVTNLEGSTSGKLAIRGSTLKPIVTGYADMQRTAMRVVYLNTKYSFSNSIEFIKNGIKFDKLIIYDTIGNQATINGNLSYNYFSEPNFNVVISTNGLLFFNTTENMNDVYYGSAVAAGKISISGSPSNIDLGINIKTKKGTSVTLPLNNSVEISDKDYIIFTQNATDSIVKNNFVKLKEKKTASKLNYNIGVNMTVTPVAQVKISLPDDMGTIEASGNSNLALDINSSGKFSLVGDYVVDNGLFHFKIGNLVSKRFSLVKGGRISWTGDPYQANVDIKGLYKVKTSLSSLGIVIDTTASYKNKVTVDCYVVLTDKLLNPTIKFEIQIPELDPDLQRLVYSELDTTNTAEMNQQMISLLVLGTFSFNNAANVSLQSSYYNVIANQLSSILSRISDNVDVGVNYKPGDNVSEQEFEVALSTQLFNNRLTIDGNFGMTYDKSQQSASNIVGDVDIGYKLTPDGQWILKVFNHSNVNSWYNYNNYDQISPYTQGVGIAFVRNFNKLSQLFISKKKNKQEQKKKNDRNNNNINKPDNKTL